MRSASEPSFRWASPIDFRVFGGEAAGMIVWTCRAPAKINLALHVTGKRTDGYHALESLVVFADIHDIVSSRYNADAEAGMVTLKTSGQFADQIPANGDNLVCRAATEWNSSRGSRDKVAIELEKRLPPASGIGGGSADAAATLITLARQDNIVDQAELAEIAPRLGADVLMCLHSRPLVATGIGDRIEPLSGFPKLAMILVNPMVAVPTSSVFATLEKHDNPPLPGIDVQTADWIGYLQHTRNDLQTSAKKHCPAIGEVLTEIGSTENVRLARMSGSGATCFGLYDSVADAEKAAAGLRRRRPGWWIKATTSIEGPENYLERAWQV